MDSLHLFSDIYGFYFHFLEFLAAGGSNAHTDISSAK